jgi:hypothetical protein
MTYRFGHLANRGPTKPEEERKKEKTNLSTDLANSESDQRNARTRVAKTAPIHAASGSPDVGQKSGRRS